MEQWLHCTHGPVLLESHYNVVTIIIIHIWFLKLYYDIKLAAEGAESYSRSLFAAWFGILKEWKSNEWISLSAWSVEVELSWIEKVDFDRLSAVWSSGDWSNETGCMSTWYSPLSPLRDFPADWLNGKPYVELEPFVCRLCSSWHAHPPAAAS